MVRQLSYYEWQYISGFLQAAVLSHVCQTTWCALEARHLSCSVDLKAVSTVVDSLQSEVKLHTLRIKSRDMSDAGAQALAQLWHEPSLKVLLLDLKHTFVGDGGAQALALLKDAPSPEGPRPGPPRHRDRQQWCAGICGAVRGPVAPGGPAAPPQRQDQGLRGRSAGRAVGRAVAAGPANGHCGIHG